MPLRDFPWYNGRNGQITKLEEAGMIEKAVGKYNQSGCKAVYVVEFSRNKGFGGFWDNACEIFEELGKVSVKEENTGLLGVKMLEGSFDWEQQKGDFYYIGVNCYVK